MEAIPCLMAARLHALRHLARAPFVQTRRFITAFLFSCEGAGACLRKRESLHRKAAAVSRHSAHARTDIKAHMIDSTLWNQD